MHKKSFHRDKMADTIQKSLGLLIIQEMDDERLRLVSISGVTLSKDLAHARVYFSVIGDSNKVKAAGDALERAAGFLRTRLAATAGFRLTPTLHFVHDPSFEYGEKIDVLIEKAKRKDLE